MKPTFKKSCTVILASLVMALSAVGVTPAYAAGPLYVAEGGDDGNSCLSAGDPCATINGAIGKAAASGDTINVATGVYTGVATEVVLIDKSIAISGGWDASFTVQSGTSTIDGEAARRGVTVNNGVTASMDRFVIQNGSFSTPPIFARFGGGIYNLGDLTLSNTTVTHNTAEGANDGGAGIYNTGTLTLNNSVVTDNLTDNIGGGIYNSSDNAVGIVILNNSTVSYNTASAADLGVGFGGGIYTAGGSLTLNNSAIIGNNADAAGGGGGGIISYGSTLILNNSTVSGNTTTNTTLPGTTSSGGGIYANAGSVTLNNSTVSGNTADNGVGIGGLGGGIYNYSSSSVIMLQNTIVSGNNASVGSPDCSDAIGSSGYNLIGNNSGCGFSTTMGDLVGTSASPINPLLGALQDNGGPTFTHALLAGSPALNAGNPAAPGGGGNACLATDQRGVARPVGILCDIGAYEGYVTPVISVIRANPNPTNALTVDFTVTFAESVTGVDTVAPFSDFALTTTGLTGASIAAVSGSGDTYTVTVNTGSGSGNGSLRLDVVDDDSILDASNNPLGGVGAGNGNFTSGEEYTVLNIPTPVSPTGLITDTTPTYSWTKIPEAAQYQYELIKGAKTIYTKTVAAGACSAACSNTPTTILSTGNYKWRVRAMVAGLWKDYSAYMTFTVAAAKPGLWRGAGVDLYVIPTGLKVDNFAIYIRVSGCGSYKITHTPLASIVNKRFAFKGSFYANGTFSSPTRAKGTLGLRSFRIPGCGYVTGGPFSWTAKWRNYNQSLALDVEEMTLTVAPLESGLDAEAAPAFFDVEKIDP